MAAAAPGRLPTGSWSRPSGMGCPISGTAAACIPMPRPRSPIADARSPPASAPGGGSRSGMKGTAAAKALPPSGRPACSRGRNGGEPGSAPLSPAARKPAPTALTSARFSMSARRSRPPASMPRRSACTNFTSTASAWATTSSPPAGPSTRSACNTRPTMSRPCCVRAPMRRVPSWATAGTAAISAGGSATITASAPRSSPSWSSRSPTARPRPSSPTAPGKPPSAPSSNPT